MPKFDVHRIESFRVKIAEIDADSPEDALRMSDHADLSILSREMDVPVSKVTPRAYVAALAHHEAPPSGAMVEISGSHGDQGEHHFDYDADTDDDWRRAKLPSDAGDTAPATIAPGVDPGDALRAAQGAIDALLLQVSQMRGMFDESADPTIAEAVEAGEEAQRLLASVLSVGAAQDTSSSPARPRER